MTLWEAAVRQESRLHHKGTAILYSLRSVKQVAIVREMGKIVLTKRIRVVSVDSFAWESKLFGTNNQNACLGKVNLAQAAFAAHKKVNFLVTTHLLG